jgi:MFS-type transporter involved in bile tolerance (Atg22 family)
MVFVEYKSMFQERNVRLIFFIVYSSKSDTATFTMAQFGAQSSFLIVVIGISLALGLGDVATAQVSQGINSVWVAVGFSLGWNYLPSVGINHTLPEGRSLLTQGFVQNWKTAKRINKHYARGLRWFLFAIVFAEAATNAFTVVSVVYLDGHIGMSGSEIGIFFFVTLLGTLPGSKLGAFVTHRTDPNTSIRLCMACLTVVTIVGALILSKGMLVLSYVWGVCIGVMLGWFYPTENLFFSMCLPKGHEAELSGFYVYCTQILGWLPPLIFSLLVSNDVSQKYGVMSVTVFFLVAIGLLSCAAPWDEIVDEVSQSIDEQNLDQCKKAAEVP